MNLFSTDRREPFQELVYCRTLIEVLEQGGNLEARTSKAPHSTKFASLPVDGATSTPVHAASLSSIDGDRGDLHLLRVHPVVDTFRPRGQLPGSRVVRAPLGYRSALRQGDSRTLGGCTVPNSEIEEPFGMGMTGDLIC